MTAEMATVGRPAPPRVATRDTRVIRWTGLYIAASAGAIQLLDIFADRLQLPEQFFVYVVILTVVGLPITAAGAFIRSIAMRERAGSGSRSRLGAHRPTEPGVTSKATDATRPRRAKTGDDAHMEVKEPTASAQTFQGRVTAELELAASHLRLARMRASSGDAAGADEHYDAFLRQVGVATAAIDSVIEDVQSERAELARHKA